MKVVLAKSPLRADGKIIGDAGGKAPMPARGRDALARNSDC
jgi:hypothetical protein